MPLIQSMNSKRIGVFSRRWAAMALSAALLLLAFNVHAQQGASQAAPAIPDALNSWVGWATHGENDLNCPRGTSGERTCVWPGDLSLDANPRGAQFSMRVWLAAPALVRLPGDASRWPQDVQVGGGLAMVQEQGGYPAIRLPAGEHRIAGDFEWRALPELMPIPAEVGQISLSIDGTSVPRPQLDAQGRLWMNRNASAAGVAETDSARASIYRRIDDGVPLTITTRISLNVSGKARKIQLGKILLPQSRATDIKSALPVQLDSTGNASVYSRPGTQEIIVTAVISADVAELSAPTPGPDFYDPQEVWIWIPNEVSRSVELDGLSLVDPNRTSLPADWHGHRTFLAEPGQKLSLQVVRRGVVETPNSIHLHRRIWLDTDGQGLSIRDDLSGTLSQDWRLDYAGSAKLGHLQSSDGTGGVLITENPDNGLRGVEIRQAKFDIQADLRQEDFSATMPALGWNHDVQRLSAELFLPPGWTLVSAQGVDDVSGTWWDSWTLWDFFFVLMVALSIGKLLGWRWVPLVILALVLSHGHSGAPTWLWFHLIATLALMRVLPDGWWRRGVYIWRAVALLALFGVLASFVHRQVRAGLYPQIDPDAFRTGTATSFAPMGGMSAPSSAISEKAAFDYVEEMAPVEDEDGSAGSAGLVKKRGKADVSNLSKLGSYSDYRQLNQVDPKAVVQTGPGLPTWTWNQWSLQWSGPVHKDHEMRLWLLSPTVNRGLTFVRSLLLILLALLMLRGAETTWRKHDDGDAKEPGEGDMKKPSFWKPLMNSSLVLLALGAALGVPSPAHAQVTSEASNASATPGSTIPSDALLEELRERVLAANNCDGQCVVVSRADFEVNGLAVKISAEVHAQKDAAWHLPGPADMLQIESVLLNGKLTHQLRRSADGLTLLRIPQGTHRVEVNATLPNVNVATIQFSPQTRPKFVKFASTDWTVDGVNANGVPENSLQWTRSRDSDAAEENTSAAAESTTAPPWYQVDRRIALGLPWKVYTSVTRRDTTRPQMVSIPLLTGEKVISDGFRVDKGEILVNFERGVANIVFTSELPIQEKIELVAPVEKPWTETWMLQCSRIWACETSGLPPVSLVSEGGDAEGASIAQPTWKPWPGETLSIQVTRPVGADGQSSTVENVDYTVTPGQRLMEATLSLTIRASQGGWQVVTLPEGATLQTASIDGEEQSLRLSEQKVSLPLRPGKHVYLLEWQQPWERGFAERVPQIDIGSEAVNVNINIQRGQQRWLLWATGPAWGPAIMFWTHLVILLILGFLLSRLRGLPLKTPEWFLLLLGLSQLPYIALIPIVSWFVFLTLREKKPEENWGLFNLTQLALIFLTLIATGTLYGAIHINLLLDIDMQVRGADSTDYLLKWYVDRSGAKLATPAIFSLPILVWRVLMLVWALWLVSRLLSWIPWGWRAYSSGGLWRSNPNPRRGPKGPGPVDAAPPVAQASNAQPPAGAPDAGEAEEENDRGENGVVSSAKVEARDTGVPGESQEAGKVEPPKDNKES
ncbi:hypothetical protein DFR33_10961 [Bradymonas sediminis]|nr:hypothetical protein DFR33_10961 [Bradymonas sediminis]